MNVVFVIPVFNERETLEALTEGITEHIGDRPHRILFVDDGSTDGSYDVLRGLQDTYDTVDVIKFRRNFGKTRALAAGFAHAEGDVLITMDSDLQDDPKEIPKLLGKIEEGYDLVCGWKAKRKDPWRKTIPSRIYNRCLSKVFGLALHDLNTGFKAMRIEVARRLPLHGDMHRMIAVFAADMGYRVTEVPVEHHPRRHGRSKYGCGRFSRGALDAYTAWFLTRHGDAPAHFFGKRAALISGLGAFALVIAVAWSVFALVTFSQRHVLTILLAGVIALLWLLISLVLMAFGLFMHGLGLIGELLIRRSTPADDEACIEEKSLTTD